MNNEENILKEYMIRELRSLNRKNKCNPIHPRVFALGLVRFAMKWYSQRTFWPYFQEEYERILVNNRIAKPSTEIKVGDVITINYYKKTMEVKVKSITPSIKKDEALEMYEIISIIENKGEENGN